MTLHPNDTAVLQNMESQSMDGEHVTIASEAGHFPCTYAGRLSLIYGYLVQCVDGQTRPVRHDQVREPNPFVVVKAAAECSELIGRLVGK